MSKWMKITIPAAPATLDTYSARLVALGFDSFQTEDAREFGAASPYWDMADESLAELYRDAFRLIVYLPAGPDGADSLSLLRVEFGGVEVDDVDEEDWAEAWKRYYVPIEVGERLLVHPSWLPLENPEGRAVFRNNPGMSFGTGLHASTRMCLEMLESGAVTGMRVLDIGCGSGILSLCALTLGAGSAVGVDIDPLAAAVSVENARDNGVGARFEAFAGDFLTDGALREAVGGGYDIVFSNIVADVIIALAPVVGDHMSDGALWRVSGIISPRLDDVLAAARNAGFRAVRAASRDGWEALELEKRRED